MEVVGHVKVAEGTKEFCGPCGVRKGGLEGSVLVKALPVETLIGVAFTRHPVVEGGFT